MGHGFCLQCTEHLPFTGYLDLGLDQLWFFLMFHHPAWSNSARDSDTGQKCQSSGFLSCRIIGDIFVSIVCMLIKLWCCSVGISWDCDLDLDFLTHCKPNYSFRSEICTYKLLKQEYLGEKFLVDNIIIITGGWTILLLKLPPGGTLGKWCEVIDFTSSFL